MKRVVLLKTFLCTMLLALTGCDLALDIEIPLPPHEPRLVVNALFETDTTLTVHLGRSVGIGDPDNPQVVENGRVHLFMNGELVEVLRPMVYFDQQDGPFHYVSNHVMQPGRAYRIEAEADGLPPVVAEEHTLSLPNFEIISVTRGAASDPWYREDRVVIRILDGPGRDFYHLTFPTYVVYDNYPEEGQFLASPFRSDDPVLQEGQFFDLLNIGGRRYAPAVMFSDAAFDGETYILTVDVLLPADAHPSTAAPHIRLDAATEKYYRYVRAQQVLGDNEGNPFAEPVTLPSNVAGGLGIFAGRSGHSILLESRTPSDP